MKIITKETTMVYPMQDTPSERLWLSNLDLMQGRTHLPSAYLYKPNGSSNFFEPEVLKEALSKVLVPFYPVAGRLGSDDNGRIEINCNKEGVLFAEAEADSSMNNEVGDFMPSHVRRQLVPEVDYSSGISSFPLLVLQVTKFECGGVCLGVGLHHTLADGISAIHFINSWADTARGLSISTPPFIDRTILRHRQPPLPTFHHIEYDSPPTINISDQNPENQPRESKPNSFEILKLRPDQLHILKDKAKNKYSTYEVLTAHIWRCACKARGLSDDQATKLYMSIDGRSRFSPPLPPGFFGNVVFFATPIALCGELRAESLMETVERVHKAIKKMDDKYLRSAIDFLEGVGDLTKVTQGPKTSQCPNLKITSWTRMPFYDADFGWGQPTIVRAANPCEGKAHVISCPSSDGSLLLPICLQTDHMAAFQRLFYDFS
ncbi:hypothetical protein P3X46_022680 [Hevea brasiliensis]|uniref:Uncharacterized protein n=1 Tax=Hevea brasiliensis TaxID=3981 RepID=A0ABQ9L8K3_HEVBR|nr:shikimate O-hydroxycinnamoyltransferase [Hevea brasiliensis]KAJ9162950.1 hypothetical protein P3X46_022680 [Hevea brasiliensis]